jgi:hypothetical protein
MDLSKSHKSSTNQRGAAIKAATRQRKTVAAMTFRMLHIRSYLCEWQIFMYLDTAINNIICILHENRKTVIMAWYLQILLSGSWFQIKICMLNGNKYPQMSKSNMARKTIIMFCTVLKCLIRHIVHMIRALPVDPIINKMKENVRQMIRFSMLYSSIVRITPKYVFPAT